MKKIIYISRSNNVPSALTTELARELRDYCPSYDVCYWLRSSYYIDKYLMKAEVIIILVADNTMEIGKGVYDEMIKALVYGKSVYVAYKRKCDNTLQIYVLAFYHRISGWSFNRFGIVRLGKNITKSFILSYGGPEAYQECSNIFPIKALKVQKALIERTMPMRIPYLSLKGNSRVVYVIVREKTQNIIIGRSR